MVCRTVMGNVLTLTDFPSWLRALTWSCWGPFRAGRAASRRIPNCLVGGEYTGGWGRWKTWRSLASLRMLIDYLMILLGTECVMPPNWLDLQHELLEHLSSTLTSSSPAVVCRLKCGRLSRPGARLKSWPERRADARNLWCLFDLT